MKRYKLFSLGTLLSASLAFFSWAPAQAVEIAGAKLDDSVKVAGKDLKLNGAVLRTRVVFKVYAMGLYLGKKETTPEAVLASAGPRRVTLVMLRDISGDDLSQAFTAGINSNSDLAEKGKIAPQMTKFSNMFIGVGSLKKGDSINLDWVPEKGTLVELNGKSLAEPLPDQVFYNAVLKIWIGDKPADSSLKPHLLGAKFDG